jgi:hypothetical protein
MNVTMTGFDGKLLVLKMKGYYMGIHKSAFRTTLCVYIAQVTILLWWGRGAAIFFVSPRATYRPGTGLISID